MEAVILFLVDQIQAFQCPTPILICSVYLLYGFLQGVLYHPHSLFRTERKGQSQRQEARVFFFLVHIKGLQQFISNPLFVKSGHIWCLKTIDVYIHSFLCISIFSCPGQLNRWPCHWLSEWATEWLLISPSKSNPRDLWPFRHLIRVMWRHDLTKKHRKNCECCPVSLLIVR